MIHVFHHNDLDGKCGAAIIKRYWFPTILIPKMKSGDAPLPEINFIECDYKDELGNYIDKIIAGDTVIAVDFSFKPGVMDRIKSIVGTDNIYWIDHHKTAFEYNYGFIPKGSRNANLAGCELAWKFLNPEQAIPKGVILIGDYDIWTHRYGELTENYYIGLSLFDLDPWDSQWDFKVLNANDDEIDRVAEMGRTCKFFRNNFCKQYCKDFGFETEFEGHSAFAVGLYEFGSKVFGDLIDKYDLCLSFEYDGKQFEIGIYSANPEINCGKIAQKYGGGGHPGAAGFPWPNVFLPFKINGVA